MIDINTFISTNVTQRGNSMFAPDLDANEEQIRERVKGKSVLVIGGAGTIGSSFIKAILPFQPGALVVVDINENELTELTRDLRSTPDLYMPQDYVTYPLNYAQEVFYKMFDSRNGFDIVANFSAHKHVRSEKDIFSIEALLRNNVINTKILLDKLVEYPPARFFCVSTDKAANPVNIMGASKKVMEDMIMSYCDKFPVTTARFANVAFSNGSLPLGFLNRIAKRQPLSAPTDVSRYFVSPQESGQICLLACVLGNSGEIFFPKLRKEQMKTFSEMATELLHQLGYRADECSTADEAVAKARLLSNDSKAYPVYFSESNTSGEKKYEEFFTEEEEVDMARFQSLGVVTGIEPVDQKVLNQFLEKLETILDDKESEKLDVVNVLKDFLKNFDHIETGISLDAKI